MAKKNKHGANVPDGYDENEKVGKGGWKKLPKKMLGQLKDPAIQKKGQITRAKNHELKKKQREALDGGFDLAEISNPESQAALLDILYKIATDKDHPKQFDAMVILIKQGAFNAHRTDKKEDSKEEDDKDDVKAALDYLMRKSIKDDKDKDK